MRILGIDTTAVTASAAVADITENGVNAYSLFTSRTKLTHSRNLLPMIDSVLSAADISADTLELIAVSVGPGSFTGVRIGAATAKGLASGLGIPCAAVSTLEALACNLGGISGIICPVMDARREQFYNALFRNEKRLCADRALSASELSEALEKYTGRVTLCGDGALLFASLYSGSKKIVVAPEAVRDQNALSVAVCGFKLALSGKTVTAEQLSPIYLRQSQAERNKK